MAMVATGELEDLVTAGKAAGQTNGAHGRLGAGADHADHFDRRDRVDDHFGQGYFQFGRGTEAAAAVDSGLYCRDHGRMAVAEDHGSPGAYVVNEHIAVRIENLGAGGFGDE